MEIYRSTDGNTYAAYAPASALLATAYDGDLNCFSPSRGGEPHLHRRLPGCAGVRRRSHLLSGPAAGEKRGGHRQRLLYTLTRAFFLRRGPILLARVYGTAAYIDLDGNGRRELCASSGSTAQVFFQKKRRALRGGPGGPAGGGLAGGGVPVLQRLGHRRAVPAPLGRGARFRGGALSGHRLPLAVLRWGQLPGVPG